MKEYRLNNEERRQWVLSDEGLYNWYRSFRQPIREFIKENKSEIDECILRVLNQKPAR